MKERDSKNKKKKQHFLDDEIFVQIFKVSTSQSQKSISFVNLNCFWSIIIYIFSHYCM